MSNKFALMCATFLCFVCSCGRFEPFNFYVDTTSDGSFVIRTTLKDYELLDYGLKTVYRFQSVPNLVAVKQIDTGHFRFHEANIIPDTNLIPNANTKNRNYVPSAVATSVAGCQSAYCEAGFNLVTNKIQNENLTLEPVKVCIVDSGVVPATNPIRNALLKNINLTTQSNLNTWIDHATLIASLFTGTENYGILNNNTTYAKNAKIISIKISLQTDSSEPFNTKYGSMQLAVAYDKALAEGCRIVNLSISYLSEPDPNISTAERIIMTAGAQKGVIFFAAAGNESHNTDALPVFPANYNAHNLFAVASHTSWLHKASSSNFGQNVELSAQGARISLNDINGSLVSVGGTSFAVPLAAAATSLYLGVNPGATTQEIVEDILTSTERSESSGYDLSISKFGRLNAYKLFEKGLARSFFGNKNK